VRAGRLALGDAGHPAWRVSLDIGQAPDGHDGTWAALTVAEARTLAAVLLAQAAAAESDDRPGEASLAAAGRVEVAYAGGDAYVITTRGHALLADQPADAGGGDAAATSTELLIASLASCVAYYAGRYLARHGLDRDRLQVVAEFTMATGRPAAHRGAGRPGQAPARPAGRGVALHRAQHPPAGAGYHHRARVTRGTPAERTPARYTPQGKMKLDAAKEGPQ